MRIPPSAHSLALALGTLLFGALSGCASDGALSPDGDIRSAEELHFLRPAADAPLLANPMLSFYAKRGEDREAFMYYQPRPGRSDSSVFMRFKVSATSLDRRPDGTVIQMGDSVLITIRLADPARLILDFQPSGLRFSVSKPADLKLDFRESSHDFDGDGDQDADDDRAKTALRIWKQEAPGLPWVRLASVTNFSLEELEADILGFTGYAIAY
ncbi:MAG: hypothetical protein ABIV10_08020 [Gemmatimonadaceae bacterium]